MGMPLGPPTSTPFAPLAYTPSQQPQAPAYSPPAPGALRTPGSAYGLAQLRGNISDQPYEPPAWARTVLTVDPLFQSPGQGSTPASGQSGFQRPGIPERMNVNPFGSDPIGSFLGGDAGVAAGLVPGQQRGGTYNGIATAPVTLANFSTWGREGVLALLTSALGRDYQQPENATFGQQPTMSDDTLDEAIVKGLSDFGNLVWGALDAPLKWFRDSNAFNRGKNIRELFQTGEADGFLTERITSAIFGGGERFTMDAIRSAAARQGIDYIDAMAKMYDLSPDIVAAIAQNPNMTDQELGTYTDGSALSVDPVSNLLLEGGMQLAMLAAGGVGVAKGAAVLGRSGIGALEALGGGLRGAGAAGEMTNAARVASTAGMLGRKALQINAWNTTAGWTVRGAEWGIKQLAAIGGNDELVAAMDRLMWQMPLSMNPGWNLIDGFSSHPIDAYRNLRQGQVAIGRRGTPGYVGQLDIRGQALRSGSTGEVMVARIAGREVRLGRNTEEFRTLGRLKELSPDDMTGFLGRSTGFQRDWFEKSFGEGNHNDLTWDDLRDDLFHLSLEAVREAKGAVGRLEGLEFPTRAERTAAFVRNNAKGALKVLEDNLKGTSTSIGDLFKAEFWDIAARNDTKMGLLKAPLGAWSPERAFDQFVSWTRASKIVRNAVEAGRASKDAVPVYRKTLNREFIATWRKDLAERFGPDEVVPLAFVDKLKDHGGAVESRGKGTQLVRGRQTTYTRSQLEAIVDSVLADDELAMRASNAVPRDQAAAYRKGVDPGQDPLEDQRVLGISVTQLEVIKAARAKKEPPTALPPARLLQRVAADTQRTADSLARLTPEEAWGAVYDWMDTKMAGAAATTKLVTDLDTMAQRIRERAAEKRMDESDAAVMVAGLGRIRDEMLNPLDARYASRRPALHQQWNDTAQEGLLLAQEIANHLKDEARAWRPVEVQPGVQHALPAGISGTVLTGYQALIAKVLKDGSPFLSEFDRTRLADPTIHPFLKHDILATAVSPSDRQALRAVEVALGGDPRDLIVAMLNDGGIDPTDAAAGAQAALARAQSYLDEGTNLGARAAQVARRFQTLGGSYSDELADTLDRVSGYQDAINEAAQAAAPKGKRAPKQHIGTLAMDPEDGARRSAQAVNAERASATRALSSAQSRLEAAERAVMGEEARPTAFDEGTMVWEQAAVVRGGGFEAKRQRAIAEASRLRRENGDITEVRWDKDRAVFRVSVARPKPTAPEPRPVPPVPTTLGRWNVAADYERELDNLLTNIDRGRRGEIAMDLQMYGTDAIRDPAYMPGGELEPLRAMVTRRLEAIEKDMADTPVVDPANDVRLIAQAQLRETLGHFERRDVAAAAPPPVMEAPPADALVVTEPSLPAVVTRSFSDDVAASRLARRATPLEATFAPEAQALIDAARGMGIDVVVAGWSDRVAQLEPVGHGSARQTITLGNTFPADDVAQSVEILQHEVGHALQYHDAIRPDLMADFPELGYYLPAGTPAPGFPDMVAGERDIFMAYGPDGTLEPSHAHTEAFAHAFTAYGRGEPMDPRARAYMARIAGRQELGSGATVPDGTLPDPDTGAPIGYTLRVVDASTLVTSLDDGFDRMLQPRMRHGRKSSDEQIAQIARRPDPSLLLGMESGAEGTPVILPDGQVLAGNGRVTGLRGAYIDGNAGDYAAAIADRAEGIADPVLVRVIDVPREEAIRLAVHLNYATGMPIADKALGLSRLITDADIQKLRIGANQSLEDALRSGANDDFVLAFQRHIPEQYRGSELRDTEGALSQDGIRVMEATLMARFANASDSLAGQQFIATLFEGDAEVRSLAQGTDAIGALIQAQIEGVGKPWAGVAPAFATDLVPALQRVFDLRRKLPDLQSVQEALETVGMRLEETTDDLVDLSPSQQVLARNLAMLARPGPGSGAAGLRSLLRDVARRVRGHEEAGVEAAPMDLFGGIDQSVVRDPTYPGVVNDAFRSMNVGRPEGRQFMLLPDADGITRVTDNVNAETARLHSVIDSEPTVVADLTPAMTDVTLVGDDWAALADHAQRSTGRLVIRTSTDAEADALRAFLAGDDAAVLPSEYRVMDDGTVEALGGTDGGAYAAQNALRDSLDGRDVEVRGPSTVVDPEAVRPATEIAAEVPRDIDPDFTALNGPLDDTSGADLWAREQAAAGVHRVVTPGGVHERAAQRQAGAPVGRFQFVTEINAPDAADRLRLAQEARDAAATQLEAARARVEALGPDTEAPAAAMVLSGSELDLYHRYIDSTASPTAPTRQPRTVNEVIDLLTSLDLGMPPLVGAMSEAEMETLRMSLLRVLNARLDDLGVKPTTGPARRAGPGGRVKPAKGAVSEGVGTRVDTPPTMSTPEDFSADLAEIVRTLQGRVYEAGDAMDGWEGTQYEIGMLPRRGNDGGPLAPRLPGEDWIARLDELAPGLGEELLHGRKRAWPEREGDARFAAALERVPGADLVRRIMSLGHTAFDARPERIIVKQSIDRFTDAVLKHFDGDAKQLEEAIGTIHAMVGKVHDGMSKQTFMSFPMYRRMGLVPDERFEEWMRSAFDGLEPEWYTALKAEAAQNGIKHPLAAAWRDSDNRVRAWFAKRPGGMADLVEGIYASSAGRKAHDIGRGITVFYHLARFLVDLRWLGLEVTEASILTFFQEGPGAMWEGMGRGKHAGSMPMFMGQDVLESSRTAFAWWLAQSDPGALLRTRERFLLAIVRRRQLAEFPRALRQAASESPDLAAAIRAFDGGDEIAYLKRLDTDLELATKRSQEVDAATAERLFRPWLERKVISQTEFDELMKAKRYTGHPAIDRELATLAEPWMRPLIERLGAINEIGWNDAARLIFGQTDRSNAQRLMNHPLLYWPISYQIKATKWLGGLLFDRAFGVDTGAGGAVTLGMMHQRHLDRMRTDEQYANEVVKNPTLLFFAQMLFPIAPWDLGVGLSPFTRVAIAALTAEDETEGYRRNIFSVGPGYTYYSLLPRLFYEQSKEGSWGQQAGLLGDAFSAGQRFFPYSVPVQPKSTSELYQAERQVGQDAIPTVPQQPY